MSTEHEELRMAAKTGGIQIVCPVEQLVVQPRHYTGGFVVRTKTGGDACWNPRTDDGDSRRLEVDLGLAVDWLIVGNKGAHVRVHHPYGPVLVLIPIGADPYAAARLAVLRAAAEIGRWR